MASERSCLFTLPSFYFSAPTRLRLCTTPTLCFATFPQSSVINEKILRLDLIKIALFKGAIIADGYIGLYKTILSLSIVYFIGEVVVTLTSMRPLGAPNVVGPVIGLLIIGINL